MHASPACSAVGAESFAEVRAPARGQGGDPCGAAERVPIVVLADVEPRHQHDAEPPLAACEALDRVARGHLALARDGEVEARAAAREEALHHVGPPEAGGELVAGTPRLGGDQLGRADPEAVADLNAVLAQALAGEVPPERAVLERDAGQLRAPVR